MKNFLKLLLVTITLLSMSAHAAPMPLRGTFSAAGGLASFTGTDLNNASSITFQDPWAITTPIPPNYLGEPNLFSTNNDFKVGDSGTVPMTLNISSFAPVTDFLTWSSDRFHFDLTELVRNPSSSGATDLFGKGNFSDVNGYYAPGIASIHFTAQENGPNNYAYSFTFASLPLPEPDSTALMGIGLVALLLSSRRRKTQNA
jgi:hypothetical protein